MEPSGLENSIYAASINIDYGRKCFAFEGKERAGRILYEEGIAEAMTLFKEAQVSADPQTIIRAEYAFVSQEQKLCDERDKNACNSLTLAIESLDEAFQCLELVENHTLYLAVEKSHPHRDKYRVKSFPKDAFHIACASHRTRLKNSLNAIGIDLIEKSLLEQRRSNLITAQNSYVKKQKAALTDTAANVCL